MNRPDTTPDLVLPIAFLLVLVVAFAAFMGGGCTNKPAKPAKPAAVSALENVKDADDHLATAEKHLRAEPPAVPEAKKEIAGARDQLTYATGDLKTVVKNTGENDAKARKFDEMQDDWLGPRGVTWLYIGGVLAALGVGLRVFAIFSPGGFGAILSRVSSVLLAVATFGLTGIQWLFEEVWQWLGKKRLTNGSNGEKQ